MFGWSSEVVWRYTAALGGLYLSWVRGGSSSLSPKLDPRLEVPLFEGHNPILYMIQNHAP